MQAARARCKQGFAAQHLHLRPQLEHVRRGCQRHVRRGGAGEHGTPRRRHRFRRAQPARRADTRRGDVVRGGKLAGELLQFGQQHRQRPPVGMPAGIGLGGDIAG